MTVKELKEKLRLFPDDMEIWSSYEDCWGYDVPKYPRLIPGKMLHFSDKGEKTYSFDNYGFEEYELIGEQQILRIC